MESHAENVGVDMTIEFYEKFGFVVLSQLLINVFLWPAIKGLQAATA